ncbi:hypothetical protein CSC3H3_17455 [Thalassospira marina]|uniref:Uncharacterized protein n=1 Tax=Thalassospira marina TaxID=2048283 RepID=A0A2N3KGN6_9PROT|nr:hypothetical protein CSC3H3_17455 [Thalassospira marina]PKR49680.1 hypothetical protein COO20_21875 [Thalassospira marina]
MIKAFASRIQRYRQAGIDQADQAETAIALPQDGNKTGRNAHIWRIRPVRSDQYVGFSQLPQTQG